MNEMNTQMITDEVVSLGESQEIKQSLWCDRNTIQNMKKGLEPKKMSNTSREKFEQVYERYKNLIMKLAVDRIHNYHTAQEICQITFMEYYIKINTIDDEIIKPWLMLVAKNASIDHLRKACNRREQTGLDKVENSSVVVAHNNIEEMVSMLSNNELIDKILIDLKTTNILWYEIIIAISIQDRQQSEVAEELGITQPMLRSRLYRAREWIRKKYGDEHDFNKS